MVLCHYLPSHDYENFPCCFINKHGCYAMCYVIILSSSCIAGFKKTVVLIKLQKVNKSGKGRIIEIIDIIIKSIISMGRMQDSKGFYSNAWSNFSNFPYNLYFG